MNVSRPLHIRKIAMVLKVGAQVLALSVHYFHQGVIGLVILVYDWFLFDLGTLNNVCKDTLSLGILNGLIRSKNFRFGFT